MNSITPLRRTVWILGACLAVQASILTGSAQENASPLPLGKPKLKTVAAFKNGLGFCVKNGTVELQAGWVALEPLPAAALGALWIGTTGKAGPVTDLVAYKEKLKEERSVLSQVELLAANVGQRVKLIYSAATPVVVEGVLIGLESEHKHDERPSDPAVSSMAWRSPTETVRSPEVVLIRTTVNDQTRILSINSGLIQAVELADGARLKTSVEREIERAKLHVEGNPARADITLAYLEKGMVWSPAYRVELENDKTANLALEAVLANDVEDFEDVEVSFVVGYPNFLYADLVSPLSLQQTVAGFIQSLSAERRPDQYSRFANVMAQTVAYNSARFEPGSRPEAAYSATQTMPGETSEDLYFYRKTGVSLRKGNRARFVLFSAQVPCEHLYQCEIPDNMNVDERGYRIDGGPRKDTDPQVWHVLRLENTTQRPWTTAPAFALNGSLPLAQDVLNYAPPGARSSLRLTAATDLRVEHSQTELSRKALQIEGRSVDEVRVAGKIRLANWKSKETNISVKKSLMGEVLQAEADGKANKVAQKLTSLNPSSEIQWEFELPAGKAKEVHYEYRVLVYR